MFLCWFLSKLYCFFMLQYSFQAFKASGKKWSSQWGPFLTELWSFIFLLWKAKVTIFEYTLKYIVFS